MKPITLTKAQEERARELHEKYLFIDCLCGNLVNPEPPERDGKTYLQRVRRQHPEHHPLLPPGQL